MPMTTNLFPLPYWAPAFQRVPLFLRHQDEAHTLRDRPQRKRAACQIPVSEQKTLMAGASSPDVSRGSSPAMTSGNRIWP